MVTVSITLDVLKWDKQLKTLSAKQEDIPDLAKQDRNPPNKIVVFSPHTQKTIDFVLNRIVTRSSTNPTTNQNLPYRIWYYAPSQRLDTVIDLVIKEAPHGSLILNSTLVI